MKILVVAACPFPMARGTPVRILRLAEALAERAHDVHVATYHLGQGPVAQAVRLHRIPEIRSYTRMSPGPTYRKILVVDRALRRLVRALLADGGFEVVHAHHYEGLLVSAGAAKDRGIPIVYDAHTLLASELSYYPLGLPAAVKRAVGLAFDRWLPRRADHTVCVSETIRDKLVHDAGLSPEAVSVVSNGVEVAHFEPAAHPRRSPRHPPSLVFTGNLAEYQGIDLLLQAFARVAARSADVRLRIATHSPFEPYADLARQLGIHDRIDLVMRPTFADLPQILADSDIAVNPRVDCDGVPVKLLNYMAAGKPVVSFDSSAPGVVHGRTGWLAPGGDVAAFAEGILALLRDAGLSDRLGRDARAWVVQHSSWDLSAKRCESVYERLLAARG